MDGCVVVDGCVDGCVVVGFFPIVMHPVKLIVRKIRDLIFDFFLMDKGLFSLQKHFSGRL